MYWVLCNELTEATDATKNCLGHLFIVDSATDALPGNIENAWLFSDAMEVSFILDLQ